LTSPGRGAVRPADRSPLRSRGQGHAGRKSAPVQRGWRPLLRREKRKSPALRSNCSQLCSRTTPAARRPGGPPLGALSYRGRSTSVGPSGAHCRLGRGAVGRSRHRGSTCFFWDAPASRGHFDHTPATATRQPWPNRERDAVLENGVASRDGRCLSVRDAPRSAAWPGDHDGLSRGSDTGTVRWAAPGERPSRAG
jgi:hypothetical protein